MESKNNILDLTLIIKRGRIQGIGNELFTPELAVKIGAAYGSYLGPNGIVVVSREYNNNNRMLKRAFISGLMSAGVDILNLHFAPLPVLQFCIRRFGAGGGVYFASFNAENLQNQIRFFDASGVEYDNLNIDSINEYFKNPDQFYRAKPLEVGSIVDIPHTQDIYVKAIPQFVDKRIINDKNLRIVLDCSYGTGSITLPSILTEFNSIDVISINSYENDSKSVKMFPNLKSMKDMSSIVKASHSDLGVILDTDGSRAIYVDETGKQLSYEELMMLFLRFDKNIQKTKDALIISSESSSKILDEYAKSINVKRIIKTKNFPGQISRVMREQQAVFGGSDTKKFYFSNFGPFSDAIYTTLNIIEIMARENIPLSELVRPFPRTIQSYKSIPFEAEKLAKFQERIRELMDKKIPPNWDYQDTLSGLKLIIKNKGWVLVSPSILEDAIILEAESKNGESGEDLIQKVEKFIDSCYI